MKEEKQHRAQKEDWAGKKKRARIATEVFDSLSLTKELLPFIFLKTYECPPSSFWKRPKATDLCLSHVGSSLDPAESSPKSWLSPYFVGKSWSNNSGTSVSLLVKRCIMSLLIGEN